MERIKCEYAVYDRYCELFDQMKFKADTYAPTMEELEVLIEPDFPKFALFLLWVDETGVRTEENHRSRDKISQMLKDGLVLV